MMIHQFDPNVNKIYCDLDGVLADFDAFVFEKMGRTFNHADGPQDDEMWKFLITVPRLYRILRPTKYAFELWHALHSYGAPVEILTGIPRRYPIPGAEDDKEEWVHLYFSPEVKVNFGPYSMDKWKWAKNGDILVDDRQDVIQSWINQGLGIGVLHDYSDHQKTIEALKLATASR
jgi:5' nucleotidase, deoxy (Pyrimidine), cytosolic type C protein (NT5C)